MESFLIRCHRGLGGIYNATLTQRLHSRTVIAKVLPRSLLGARAGSSADDLLHELECLIDAGSVGHPNLMSPLALLLGERFVLVATEIGVDLLKGVTKRAQTAHPTKRTKEYFAEHERFVRGDFVQLLRGVHAMHQGMQRAHLDLSLENAIELPDGRVQVIDYGLARKMERSKAHASGFLPLRGEDRHGGKPPYMCPAHYENRDIDGVACDVWSLGCMLYAMVAGLFLVLKPCPEDKRFAVLSGRNQLEHAGVPRESSGLTKILAVDGMHGKISPELVDLLHRMLAIDPAKRDTPGALLHHPWCAAEGGGGGVVRGVGRLPCGGGGMEVEGEADEDEESDEGETVDRDEERADAVAAGTRHAPTSAAPGRQATGRGLHPSPSRVRSLRMGTADSRCCSAASSASSPKSGWER